MESVRSLGTRRVSIFLINVEVHDEAGCFIATSQQFPEICIVHPDLEAIFNDMPKIIAAIFKDRYEAEVEVLPADEPDGHISSNSTWPWVAIPKAYIAAQALAAH